MTTNVSQPLILTLHIDEEAQAFYEDLRRRYFPPERNHISAHLTLFHQLPDDDRTNQTLREAAKLTWGFTLSDAHSRSIGQGVAVFFRSDDLAALHTALSTAFQGHVIPQDRQRLRPHIVVQNKVDRETARHTLTQMQAAPLINPRAIGLTLWRYLGGPWERLGDFPFGVSATSADRSHAPPDT